MAPEIDLDTVVVRGQLPQDVKIQLADLGQGLVPVTVPVNVSDNPVGMAILVGLRS